MKLERVRSRGVEVEAVRMGAGAEGVSETAACCACSVVPRNACGAVPRKKIARESETRGLDERCFDEKSECILPLGWCRGWMLSPSVVGSVHSLTRDCIQ